MVKATGGTLTQVFVSIIQTAGARANINKLTHVLAGLLAGGNPDTLFTASTASNFGTLMSATRIAANVTLIQTNILAAFTGISGVTQTFDFLSGTFSLDLSGIDQLFDTISVAITGTNVAVNHVNGTALFVFAASSTGSSTATTTKSKADIDAIGFLDGRGLKEFALALRNVVFATTAQFSSISSAQERMVAANVASLTSAFFTTATTTLFELITSANPSAGIKVRTAFTSLFTTTLAEQVPTIVSTVDNSVSLLAVRFNYAASSTSAVTAIQGVAQRVNSTTGATAWRLRSVTTP